MDFLPGNTVRVASDEHEHYDQYGTITKRTADEARDCALVQLYNHDEPTRIRRDDLENVDDIACVVDSQHTSEAGNPFHAMGATVYEACEPDSPFHWMCTTADEVSDPFPYTVRARSYDSTRHVWCYTVSTPGGDMEVTREFDEHELTTDVLPDPKFRIGQDAYLPGEESNVQVLKRRPVIMPGCENPVWMYTVVTDNGTTNLKVLEGALEEDEHSARIHDTREALMSALAAMSSHGQKSVKLLDSLNGADMFDAEFEGQTGEDVAAELCEAQRHVRNALAHVRSVAPEG